MGKVVIKCKGKYPNHVYTEGERSKETEEQELLHTIISLYGEKYNRGGLRTLHAICSLKEKIIRKTMVDPVFE